MSTLIRRTDDILATPLDDTLLMMSVRQGRYYGLNGAGPRIWELLAEPTTAEALVAALLEEFEVEPAACAAEVAAFLDELRANNLLTEDGAAAR